MSISVMKTGGFLNLENARSEDQRRVMERLSEEGKCPFCPEGIAEQELRGEARPVIRGGTYWHVRENNWPYENTRAHLLVILDRHAEQLGELSPLEWAELLDHIQWAEAEYQITGGGFGIRFGDIRVNGATVSHLHAHIITPAITERGDPNYKEVRFRVG